MKASTLSSLALSGSLLTTGITGCETRPTGEQAHLANPTANYQLSIAHRQIVTCANKNDQAERQTCLDTALKARTQALSIAGLPTETESVEVSCSGEDPCSIVFSVRSDLCKPRDCNVIPAR